MRARWMGVVVLVATLAGCAGPDLSPVPTQAAAPFVCDGVPQAGMALTLGVPVKATQDVGAWGDKSRGFYCAVKRQDGVRGAVLVADEDLRDVAPTHGEEGQRATLKSQANPAPIDADADGWGYVVGTGNEPTAAWVCNGRYITVDLVSVDVEGRDPRADAQALLVSMLPWSCGDQKVPARTVGK